MTWYYLWVNSYQLLFFIIIILHSHIYLYTMKIKGKMVSTLSFLICPITYVSCIFKRLKFIALGGILLNKKILQSNWYCLHFLKKNNPGGETKIENSVTKTNENS